MGYEPTERDAKVAVAVEWTRAVSIMAYLSGSRHTTRQSVLIAELIKAAREVENMLYDQIDD